MTDDFKEFAEFRTKSRELFQQDEELRRKLLESQIQLDKYKYGYQFDWLGVPIIRLPDDIVVLQELIWEYKPQAIIEIGVARGGSVVFSASMQRLIGENGITIGVDIDLRQHNRLVIESHPIGKDVILIEGDSTSPEVFEKISELVKDCSRKIVVLDGNHTEEKVLRELELYSALLEVGDYFCLPDTVIEFFPIGYFSSSRPWDKGNNPLTALNKFLEYRDNFKVDEYYSSKAAISETPHGYVKKISN